MKNEFTSALQRYILTGSAQKQQQEAELVHWQLLKSVQ